MGSSNICDIICHKRSSAHNLQGTVQDQGHSLIEEKMLLRVGVLLLWLVRTAQGNHVEDKFHYNATDWIQHIYGPADWNLVQCDDVATCPGWPTNFEAIKPFIPYEGSDNMCKDCSKRRRGVCADHRQSPIPLSRNVTAIRECIDRHLMKYGTGECHVNNMNFQILPHVLRAYLPRRCPSQPWIDFSMGFPFPWLLKFTDITIPSQHTQDGKRYDAEVVLTHVYSKNNPKKMIGNLAIFLERGSEADHYDFLELHIRQFRATANRIKDACLLRQRRRAFEAGGNGTQATSSHTSIAQKIRSSSTLNIPNSQSMLRNSHPLSHDDNGQVVDDDRGVKFQDDDLSVPNVNDDGLALEDDLLVFSRDNDDESLGIMIQKPYFNRTFHPYDWYAQAKTWYYFRYVGSMPEPPCFEGVHWRVLKDPIKVAPSQLRSIERLMANRIDPVTCKSSTAGTRRFPNRDPRRLAYNRPLQTVTEEHKLMYCECIDFVSRAENDLAYCKLNMTQRGVFNYTNISGVVT